MGNDLMNQPTAVPTRKMLYGAVSAVATVAAQQVTVAIAGAHPLLTWMASDAAMQALPVIVGFGVGYLVKERA